MAAPASPQGALSSSVGRAGARGRSVAGRTVSGAPDPTRSNEPRLPRWPRPGVLVFREGLEAILVLAAVTAGLMRRRLATGARSPWEPGSLCWPARDLVRGGRRDLGDQRSRAVHPSGHRPARHRRAPVMMNWFFTQVYWTGWIAHHNRRGRELLERRARTARAPSWASCLLGFTAIYRRASRWCSSCRACASRPAPTWSCRASRSASCSTAVVGCLTFVAQPAPPLQEDAGGHRDPAGRGARGDGGGERAGAAARRLAARDTAPGQSARLAGRLVSPSSRRWRASPPRCSPRSPCRLLPRRAVRQRAGAATVVRVLTPSGDRLTEQRAVRPVGRVPKRPGPACRGEPFLY